MKLSTVADAAVADAGDLKANDRAELEQRFDHLLAANGAAFRRLAATYTRTAGDRDDLLQEVALAIWKALPAFRGECTERTFVFRIAHNRSVAYLARAHSRTAASVEEVEVEDPAPNVETELAQEQRATRLRRAIQRLPLGYQQVISFMLEGLEYAEIAEVLGISENECGSTFDARAADVASGIGECRMNTDAELELWRQEWQSDSAVPADLRMKVERQSLWMRIGLAADILVTVVIGGGVIFFELRSPESDMGVLAGATWLFLLTAWVFAIKVNRDNWSPSALDTNTFLDLSVRRCRSRLMVVRFAAVLFVCEVVFCLGWIYRHTAEPRKPLASWLWFGSTAVDLYWVMTPLFFGFLFWYRRKKLAELAYLHRLCSEFGEATGEPDSKLTHVH